MPSAVRFSVRDNGRGIPPEEIPHIFERFHSGAADAVPHSTGLGMAISRQIFRVHGCELTVYSDGSGTEILSFFRQL
jgi:signal transduction histidine kinase